MRTKAEWWRNGAKELYRGESDGQKFISVFSQEIGDKTEYAVVECSDGDYLDYIFGGLVISGEAVTPIKPDCC